jgi:hypothetical protein
VDNFKNARYNQIQNLTNQETHDQRRTTQTRHTGSASAAIRGAPIQPDIARTTGQPGLAEIEAHSQQSQRPSGKALSNQLEGLQGEPKAFRLTPKIFLKDASGGDI